MTHSGQLLSMFVSKLNSPSSTNPRKPLSTGASLVAQMVKNLSVMPETLVQSLEWGTLLAWRISWTEEPGGLQFKGLQRIRHD